MTRAEIIAYNAVVADMAAIAEAAEDLLQALPPSNEEEASDAC